MKSLDELKAIREKTIKEMRIRSGGESDEIRILVGMGTCGISAGARDTLSTLVEEIKNRDLQGVYVSQVGCEGSCHSEPIVQVSVPNKEPVLYGNVTSEKSKEIIEKHVLKGEILEDLVIGKSFH